MEIVNPCVAEHAEALGASFRDASPFRHVVVDDFFDEDLCQSLIDGFPRFEERFARNEMGEIGGKAVRTTVRDLSGAYRRLDDEIRSEGFLRLIERITGIQDLLYDPDYEGGGTHENRQGQSLDAHVDFNYHPRTGWHRRLNLIVYLSPEWDPAWGGALELQSDPWNPASSERVVLPPQCNRCVIFETTESSWHGFPEIRLPESKRDLSRQSFAIYLYTRERPAEETAPSHATVYVPEGMPRDMQPGRVLDQGRFNDLGLRFARLFGQLRFMYEREKRHSRDYEELRAALEAERATRKIDLQGWVIQHGAHGIWQDMWCGQDVEIGFEPTRKARGIELKLWTPEALDGQTLHIDLDGQRFTQALRPGHKDPIVLEVPMAAGSKARLSLQADASWMPSSDGRSGDGRGLSYKLLEAKLLQD